MKYIYGLILIGYLGIDQVLKPNIDILSIAFLLGILCLFIIKERFLNRNYSSIILLFFIVLLSLHKFEFILLLCIPILDFLYFGQLLLGGLSLAIGVFVSIQNGSYNYGLHMILAALFGHMIGQKETNEAQQNLALDEERRLRYRLEETQNQLINSRKEIEHLTEIRERNRIAHEIHDNVGHSIAGVIFQIEAAKRIIHKDKEKLEGILNLCSVKLSEALELTRNTVYNIKPDKKVGLELLEKIIKDFKFAYINFEHSGDFSKVSASNMEILENNLMECLTNATKYSQAQSINIKIDVGRKNIRFYYKDDGIGCDNIYENLGIVGMRDRVKNVGGTIAIDGGNGFLIVCNLPVETEEYEGEIVLESSDC